MLTALVAAIVLLLSVPFDGAPASAHAQLVSSSPASGDRLDAGPERIELTFSEDLLTLGAAISLVDADGTEWIDGPISLDGPRAIAPVAAGLPEARYEVRWQVVSADGHPISGVIAFAIGDAALDAPGAGPAADSGADGADSADGADDGLPEALRTTLIAAGGAALAVAALWLVSRLRGRRAAAHP